MAGKSIPARMAMMAITTSNSTSVNPREAERLVFITLIGIRIKCLWARGKLCVDCFSLRLSWRLTYKFLFLLPFRPIFPAHGFGFHQNEWSRQRLHFDR